LNALRYYAASSASPASSQGKRGILEFREAIELGQPIFVRFQRAETHNETLQLAPSEVSIISMTAKWKVLALLAILCCAGGIFGPKIAMGGGKKGKFSISFHIQGDETEGNRRVKEEVVNGQRVYFRRSPVITHKNCDGYWPFPADDGTYGVAFHLSASGRRRISTIAITERGKFMRTVVNMRMVDTLIIDAQPDDMIVVWKGFTERDLKQISKMMPQISEQVSEQDSDW
jgi:hypothetical protein